MHKIHGQVTRDILASDLNLFEKRIRKSKHIFDFHSAYSWDIAI